MIKLKRTTLWARLIVLAIGICVLVAPTSAFSAGTAVIGVKTVSSDLVFDGKKLQLPQNQYLFMVNGTNYVPLRFVSYALMKSVAWDGKTSTVTVKTPSKAEETGLKEYLMNAVAPAGAASAKAGVAVKIAKVQVKLVFDGQVKALPAGQSGYMLNNTIYVPIRFMSEATGSVIKWDPVTKQITGESKAYRDSQNGNTGTGQNPGQGQTGTGTTVNTGNTGSTGGATKPSKASIEASAESRLKTLETACTNDLMAIGMSYLSAGTETEKQQIIAQGEAKVSACESSFNSIVAETEASLTANGYTTEKIAEYRQYFQEQLAAGREILNGMAS